jgi:hypothetical protein
MDSILSSNMPQDNPSHKKWCTKCKSWLPFRVFPTARNKKDGLHYCCKECKNTKARETTTTKQIRAQNMRRLHDVSLKEYDRMFVEQGGVCYVCKQPETAKSRTGIVRPLAIDHDHETGEIRSLLCHVCNVALGFIEKDPERTRMLIEYKEEMGKREPVIKIVQLSLLG